MTTTVPRASQLALFIITPLAVTGPVYRSLLEKLLPFEGACSHKDFKSIDLTEDRVKAMLGGMSEYVEGDRTVSAKALKGQHTLVIVQAEEELVLERIRRECRLYPDVFMTSTQEDADRWREALRPLLYPKPLSHPGMRG